MIRKKNMLKSKISQHSRLYSGGLYAIIAVLIICSIFILAPQIDSLKQGIKEAQQAHVPYIMISAFIVPFTFLSASFAIWCLSLKPLLLREAFLMQLASGFATKLVPAGVGGFALNTRFLVKRGHTLTQALAVMTINNTLGILGHIAIVIAALAMSSQLVEDLELVRVPNLKWILAAVVTAALIIFLLPTLRLKIKGILKELGLTLNYYRGKPKKLLGGLLGAFGVTLLFALVLYFCAKSLGVDLMWLEVLIVFSLGIIGATVTPTPGGIGGAEAALTAGFVLLGIDASKAFSIALLYRLLAFWLPILPGFICLQFALRRKII